MKKVHFIIIVLLMILTTVLSANNWKKVNLEKDPFTGKESVAFVNTSKNKGKFGKNIELIVRCSQKSNPEIFVNWFVYLDSKKVKMLVRKIGYNEEYEKKVSKIKADSEEEYRKMGVDLLYASGRYYPVSQDFTALFFPDNDTLESNYELSIKAELYSLVHDKSLVLKVAPYGSAPIIAEFNLPGLKELIVPYKEMCKLPNEAEYLIIMNKIISNTKKELAKYEK